MEEKKEKKKKAPRRLDVFREGSTGAPPVALVNQKDGHERGFPTKAEFKRLFKSHEILLSKDKDWKRYEFAAATHKPHAMREWVADQVKAHETRPGEAMGVWCKLPRGSKKAQDAVPLQGTVFPLVSQKGRKLFDALVLYSSERSTRCERGVAFLVIGNAIDA